MPNRMAEEFRNQAERCRRLADLTTNREVAQKLLELAKELEAKAADAEARNSCRPD
jgi:hypothetical protein